MNAYGTPADRRKIFVKLPSLRLDISLSSNLSGNYDNFLSSLSKINLAILPRPPAILSTDPMCLRFINA